jgi:cytochrome o ubiquinol oxidase subunit I
MTRRIPDYPRGTGWEGLNRLSTLGSYVIALAMIAFAVNVVVSLRRRIDAGEDPWGGQTLEWATTSPPPPFNFAVLPNVRGEEPYWDIKRRAIEAQQLSPEPKYEAIEMPRNSPTGFITAFFSTLTGFALIWHIWWLVGVGIVAAYAVFVWFAWRDAVEYSIPAEEVARYDRERRRAREQWLAQHAGQPA